MLCKWLFSFKKADETPPFGLEDSNWWKELPEVITDPKERLIGGYRKRYGYTDGGTMDSMRAMHHGGFVTKTGPAFLQKGEVVFPKNFADGGQVYGEVSKLLEEELPSLQDITIKIDTSELESLLREATVQIDPESIKNALADVELSVDPAPITDALEGIALSVEDKEFVAVLADPSVTVEFDDTTVVRNISGAVAEAVSNITVTAELAGGAIGADEATVAAAIESMDNKLLDMKGNLEDKISMVGQVNTNDVMRNVETLVNNIVNNTVLEIRSVESVVDNLRSEVQREKDLTIYVRSEVDRKIAEIYNTIL